MTEENKDWYNEKQSVHNEEDCRVNYRYVIWDWNGTLLDDLAVCLEVINSVLERRKMVTLTSDKYGEVFGFPVREYYGRLGFDFTDEPFEAIAAEFVAGYQARSPQAKLRSGTRRVLQAIAQTGAEQLVLSASNREYLAEQVASFGIQEYFTELLGIDNHYAAGKEGIALEWKQRVGLQPGQAVIVGDTIHDFEIAACLECDCVLVESGHQSKARLETLGVPVFSCLEQVSHWLIRQ